jgi:phosphopantetheine adenylyltransferase
LLFADPSLSFLSSSMVRELIHFGKDVREFLPTAKK